MKRYIKIRYAVSGYGSSKRYVITSYEEIGNNESDITNMDKNILLTGDLTKLGWTYINSMYNLIVDTKHVRYNDDSKDDETLAFHYFMFKWIKMKTYITNLT